MCKAFNIEDYAKLTGLERLEALAQTGFLLVDIFCEPLPAILPRKRKAYREAMADSLESFKNRLNQAMTLSDNKPKIAFAYSRAIRALNELTNGSIQLQDSTTISLRDFEKKIANGQRSLGSKRLREIYFGKRQSR